MEQAMTRDGMSIATCSHLRLLAKGISASYRAEIPGQDSHAYDSAEMRVCWLSAQQQGWGAFSLSPILQPLLR